MTNHTKVFKWLFISLLLVSLPVVMGTKGWKKTNTGASGSGGINAISKYIENPAIETFETIHHFLTAATADSIWCQCRGTGSPTATMQWDRDDGSPSSVDAGTIVCDSDDEADTNLTGDKVFSVGHDLDLKITATGGTAVTDCTFIIYFE